jgi:hypothetical protein
MAKQAKGGATAATAAAEVTPMTLWVGRARAAGALLGFAVALWVCHRQGLGLVDSTLRALIAGAGFSLVAWWSALLTIQGLMRAAVAQRRREEEAARAEAVAARAAAAAAEAGQSPSAEPAAPLPEAG